MMSDEVEVAESKRSFATRRLLTVGVLFCQLSGSGCRVRSAMVVRQERLALSERDG